MDSAASVTLLGVTIDAVTVPQALGRLREFLASGTAHHVVTPNNEMLVASVRNPAFRAVLNAAALRLPDSTGLLLAAGCTGQRLAGRVTGVDTVTTLCATLDSDTPVFLLGAQPGVAERAAAAIQATNPRLTIAGTHAGSPKPEDAAAIIAKINDSGARLLLVAFGAPAQDLWIAEHLSALSSVRVAMGVGGTFDFLAGERSRAPSILRRFGLEWVWRLLQQPSRWKRIWTAVITFPLLVLRYGKRDPVN